MRFLTIHRAGIGPRRYRRGRDGGRLLVRRASVAFEAGPLDYGACATPAHFVYIYLLNHQVVVVGRLLRIRALPRAVGESEMIRSIKGMLCILSPSFARYGTSDCFWAYLPVRLPIWLELNGS